MYEVLIDLQTDDHFALISLKDWTANTTRFYLKVPKVINWKSDYRWQLKLERDMKKLVQSEYHTKQVVTLMWN